MSRDPRDELLERDWGDVWDSLPDAPALVPRPKTAQITLRIPDRLLPRIKAVAAAKTLPYHALARAWIIEALRSGSSLPSTSASAEEPQAEQLNIKLDNDTLDDLKGRADELRRPYHRLAREWIEAALAREEESLGIVPAPQPPLKDLMVFLLHSSDRHGKTAVGGITRLQKLLFVIEQHLANQSGFYAWNYGPFDEQVNDAAHALKLAGFLRGARPVAARPSFAEMMATVVERAGPRDQADVEEFALNDEGHRAADELRQSSRAYEQLYAYVERLRLEWDSPDLVERVYQKWPDYAKRSLIREQVERRAQRRRGR